MRQPRRRLALAAVIASLPLFGASGCLSLLTASQSTADRARRLARFDADCPSMRVVARLGSSRYRLRGCGQEMLYACGKETRDTGIGRGRRPRSKAGKALGLAAMLLVGPTVTSTHCQLIASKRLLGPPPAPTTRWPRSQEQPTALEDEPGFSAPATKTAAARVLASAREPVRPDPRDVRAAMVRIRPRLLACAAGRPSAAAVVAPVKLRVAREGHVTQVKVDERHLDARTRRCLERSFLALRLPASAKGPRWLSYRVRVR